MEESQGADTAMGEGFIEELRDLLSDKKEITEIPKVQRHLSRPKIEEIIKKKRIKDKRVRNKHIHKAIIQYGYSLKDVADYLNMYYTTASKALKAIELEK